MKSQNRQQPLGKIAVAWIVMAALFFSIQTAKAGFGPILFNPYITYPVNNPQAVGVGDFNHDGLNDVALSNYTGVGFDCEMNIFVQNIEGGLESAVSYSAGTRAENLAVGDFNNDGWDDVVVTNANSNTISVFLQQSDGALAARVIYATGAGPYAVAVGDVNGDGLDDVAVANWNSAFISIFIQNIGGTLNAKVDYASPQGGYDDIAVGDVNGDGLNDVIKMNGQLLNPDLHVFTQTGIGTLNSAVFYSLPGNNIGHGIGLGDVTGDGKLDVVMSYGGNTPSAFIAVFGQAEDGTLLTPVSYTAYDIPEALEVADVDDDGREDVIVVHGGWNSVSVYLQQDNGSLGSFSLYGLPYASHYKPQGLAIGDINADTWPDILVANYNFGLNVLVHIPPDLISPDVVSIIRINDSPTNAASVNFTLTFSEPVTGVDLSDFSLTQSGLSGATVSGFSGSGGTYNVSVSTGTGNGTLRLDIPDTASITDLAGNPLDGLPYLNGETYEITKTAPILYIPSNAAILHYNRPSFDWSNFPDAKGYQIQISKIASFGTTLINATVNGATNSQYTPTKDLPPNTLLFWRVRAKLSATNYSAWSSVFTFTTANPPSVPSLLAPANNQLITNLTPALDWSDSTIPAGTTFSHYQVQVDDNADFSSTLFDANTGVSTYNILILILSPNAKYYWRVRAWNTIGDTSSWSLVRSFREAMLAPTLVLPVLGVTVGNLKPLFDWSDVTGATGYTIQVSLSNAFGSLAINATINTPTSQYTHSFNLQVGKLYYWRVRANGPNGPSLWSAVETFRTP